jgi:hypothetical protein
MESFSRCIDRLNPHVYVGHPNLLVEERPNVASWAGKRPLDFKLLPNTMNS